MVPAILEEVQAYTDALTRGAVRCELAACPRCGLEGASFSLHEVRGRTYLVAVGRLVESVASLVSRWKCRSCRTTFTLYPSFALAHKRYVRQTVFERSQVYLGDERQSYRTAVRIDRMPIFHQSSAAGEALEDRTLAASTLHRWLATLGRLSKTLQQALHLIRARDPTSGLFRTLAAIVIAPWRYRSEERAALLRSGSHLLLAGPAYRALFGVSIFPNLATACRFS
jgi:transposase-like protein